ncbi:MFS transporter [Streptomyces virginiae]|uniref:MFS transporter n=1 Tax=Streptomyces virginiae TaxID=1961 RepID=UPI0022538C9B|nr:MFS transporter [Streptomyces virginiae]MCX4956800.1 MFS transporter [Streptomyces virginiae]
MLRPGKRRWRAAGRLAYARTTADHEGGRRARGSGTISAESTPYDLVPPLRRNKDFTVFWLGQALSVLGGSVSMLALPLLVLHATGSIVQMGLVTVVSGATAIGTGVFAGYVVDRVDRRRLMIVCDLARAVLLGAVPLVWWIAGPQIWLLYVLTASAAVLKTLFDVAYVTAIPNLVRTQDLTAANGRLMGTFALGSLLGPVVAGFLTAGVGADWALALDGATFLVSAASLGWVRFTARPAGEGADKAVDSAGSGAGAGAGVLREMFVVGFRFLWSHPLLRPLTIQLTLLTFVTMGATDLLIYRVQHDLGRDAATLGYVIAVSGAGSVAAALCAGRLRRLLGFGTCWLASIAMIAVGVTVTGVSRSVPVIAVLAAVFMFGITLGGICTMTLRQEVTPDHLLGRVTSAFWTVHNASGPVGAAVLTLLAARHGVPAVSLAGGALCLLILGGGLLTPLRGSRAGAAAATTGSAAPDQEPAAGPSTRA